jgi:hypothetical protein
MTIHHFYAAMFLSQVLVVSLYAPSRLLRAVRALLATRPPAEYPKLYPVPVATIERALRLHRNLNGGLAVLGLALAAWFYGYINDGGMPATIYAIYTMLQVAPIILWAHLEKRYFRRMRDAAANRIRKAELKPRRLFDLVSPKLLALLAGTYLAALVSVLLLSAAQVQNAVVSSIVYFTFVTIANLFAAGSLVWRLTGRRLDPHQTHNDRTRLQRASWTAFLISLSLVNAYVALQSLFQIFGLFDYVGFVASLLAQLCAVAASKGPVSAVYQEDFDVYKADAQASVSAPLERR